MVEIPYELIDAFARGNGVIFAGAGLSMGAGLPGWERLMIPLADRLHLAPHLRGDVLKIAQYYENKCGRQALIDHVFEQTDTTGKAPTENHRRLLRLGVSTWITTNFDDLIEQALRQAEQRFSRIVCDQDLPYTSADRVSLLKLHGDRDQPDTIVVTEHDYYKFFRSYPRIKDKLTGLLLEKTFLFVGYSIADPDLNQILAGIAFDLQEHQRMGFAILFDADEFAASDLRSRNIQTINIMTSGDADYSDRLGAVLDEFVNQVLHKGQQLQRLHRPMLAPTPAFETSDVCGLLQAMGYRVEDTKRVGPDLYCLCSAKWGTEIRQEVVHFVGRQPTASDIATLNDAVDSCDAMRGILLTSEPLSGDLRQLAAQRTRIKCYTIDDFTNRLADFRPYVERIIQEYELSEIGHSYVPLTAKSAEREGQPLEQYVNSWLSSPGRNHLSILGDSGSGKTWFCQRYAYLAAKRYLADPEHNRIPILIALRDYSHAYDVEQLVTDAIVNRYKVTLADGYNTFDRLNQAGRLLIICDGFDEMERRVSDYRTTAENFWQLAKLVCPNGKVILSCRTAYFRHHGEEQETLVQRQRRLDVVVQQQIINLKGRQEFEVIHVQDFDDEDIQNALKKRLPVNWKPLFDQIQESSNIRDLAKRPALLDLIVKSLPNIRDTAQISLPTLYEAYVNELLTRRWSADTDYIPPQDRLFFMEELAWQMYTGQRLSIPFSEFPERVIQHFQLRDAAERAAFFERDIRTQSYLTRDDKGNYRFGPKPFMEYFVARKMATVVANADPDTHDMIEMWKAEPLAPEVREFLAPMIVDVGPLWLLIEATRGKTVSEVGYAGGNAATLLAAKKVAFKEKNLDGAVLVGADLSRADLRRTKLRKAVLRHSILTEAILRGARLDGADLRDSDLWHADLKEAYCVATDLRDTCLHGVSWGTPDRRRFTGILIEGADCEDGAMALACIPGLA